MNIARAITAVVLGGGRGTRLYPLTRYRSKPAVPLGGKYRLIDIPISNCINSGIRRIYVLTQYNSASLNHHIGATYRFDSFADGFVDILAAEQTPDSERWYQGTADAVRRNLLHLLSRDSSHVLITSGDSLWRQDFQALYQRHCDSNAEVTVVCKTVSAAEAPGLGIVELGKGGQISGFVEKPGPEAIPSLAVNAEALAQAGGRMSPDRPLLASMGIYLFNRDVLCQALRANNDEDFGRQIIPRAIRERRVFAEVFDDYWEDIGTISAFFRANLDLLEDRPPFTFHHLTAPIYTRSRLLPSSEVRDSSLQRVLLGEGSQIHGASIRRSVVGIRSLIGEGTQLDEVVMMGADYFEGESRSAPAPAGAPPLGIGRGVIARRAIIDKNARVGEGCRILNEAGIQDHDAETHSIRDGIVIIPKGAILQPGTVI